MEKYIWIFSGSNSQFPSAVFEDLKKAEKWIKEHSLSGALTKYPIDQGVYEWAISNNYFSPKKEHERSPKFIQSFSSASQEHYHYENGNKD